MYAHVCDPGSVASRVSLILFPQLISLTSCCLLLSTLCASTHSDSNLSTPWSQRMPALVSSRCEFVCFILFFGPLLFLSSFLVWGIPLGLLACPPVLCLVCFALWLAVYLHAIMADRFWCKTKTTSIAVCFTGMILKVPWGCGTALLL